MWIVARWRTLREPTNSSGLRDRQLKMKRKTASERQRNLERHYGSRSFRCRFGNGVLTRIYWAFRRLHYFLCFYDSDVEVDLEDLLTNPFNTQPPSLEDLQRLTGFRRQWIMFLYRNFKQGAIDYQFADRIFGVIAGSRSHKLITFEDLVMCLYDLTQSFKGENDGSIPSTTTAQFTFALMEPDNQGRVDENAFVQYTKCIFDLNTTASGLHSSGDAATFGMISGSTHGSNDRSARRETLYPWLQNLARQQFHMLDSNNDGYITLQDVESLFEQKTPLYESLILRSEDELQREDTELTENMQMNS